ncbi:MAG TPA: hypothetical protein VNS63_20855 [Blastocatellia bacterium]|nr:hypothetical protein [Blastocatellia bacterium]
MALFLVIVFGSAVLIAYSIIEKRINQRACPECGFKVSIDSPDGDCPSCRPVLDQEWQELARDDPFSSQHPAVRLLRHWPRIVFAGVPLTIMIVAGGLLMAEHLQSDANRAIRLVKESNSRKENFTVQQYLYVTVYHRRDQGEPIAIAGWRAEPSQADRPIRVEFLFTDTDGEHAAIWEANIKEGRVTPLNEVASDISWH